MERGQFGTAMKRGQFGTRTIWHRSVKGTIWHRDVSEEEMQFQDEREILCQMEDKYFVKYLEILTLSQHLEERGLNISNTLCV